RFADEFLAMKRRAPHGARGLKRCRTATNTRDTQSRPAWGAWIETVASSPRSTLTLSRPAWGAWIETRPSPRNLRTCPVTPRVGRVD
ncbi:hypothetical protein, partial [Selenomonas sp. FOBRC6]|uniref:hypothetical protein n=1 Tax=Selenomonas sp. FOBRC6 TaxID=936572 RepID=UPI001E2B7883